MNGRPQRPQNVFGGLTLTFGAVQLYIDIPSRGIFNVLTGQKDLTCLPRESFLVATTTAGIPAGHGPLRAA